MEMKQVAIIGVGVLFVLAGIGYYLGWWDQISDYLPWNPDTGDLKVICYDGNATADTSDDTPLANVTVSILSTELIKSTDSNGTAIFTDVEVGEYEVQAEYNSVTLSKNVTITKDTVTTVTFIFNSG